MGEVALEERLRLYAGELYCAANVGVWCFDTKGKLFYSTSPREQEFYQFLQISQCLERANAEPGGCSSPLLLSDAIRELWIAEHRYEDGKPSLLILVGPVFSSDTSPNRIRAAVQKLDLSVSTTLKMMQVIEQVPLVPYSMVIQYAQMLHYMLTENRIPPDDIRYQTEGSGSSGEDSAEAPALSDDVDSERRAGGEQLLLKAIRDGNLQYQKIMNEKCNFGGGLLTDTGDPLRDSKNTMLIFCSLAFRAAAEGGVSHYTAEQREHWYLHKIESCTSIPQLANLNQELLKECVESVRKSKEDPAVSTSVRECCDYIRTNPTKSLTSSDLASRFGYTEYYFTKKFFRETGIRLTDFIKQTRIDCAKIMLLTTNDSIQDIADELQFGTRNYFSKIFRDATGMTPAQYREQTGQIREAEHKGAAD